MLHVLVLLAAHATAADFPSAEISNGVITAKLYTPDPKRGYYRATRFDWSGVIYSLKTKNHEYFGQWFPKYDPKLHDAIMGPVEEFRTNNAGLGYDEAPVGGTFIRIGVGAVRKPEESSYQGFRTYDIVDNGKWKVRKGRNHIEFVHELKSNGYGYVYTKKITLVKGEPVMTIEHSLRNTGTKEISTMQYNHNFFVMDGQPTGPDSVVKFPFELKAVRPFAKGPARAEGSEIRYSGELQEKQSVIAEFAGRENPKDYDIRMEHHKAGAGVRITGDQPLAKVVYWSIRSTFCPEPYISVHMMPGGEHKWTYRYTFYDLAAGEATAAKQ